MIAACLVLVELVKVCFYAVQGRPTAALPTHEQRPHRPSASAHGDFTAHGRIAVP
jgi:hypothetical protein